MRFSGRIWGAIVVVVLAVYCWGSSSFADDADADFSSTNNPNGDWSYGYFPTTGVFTLLPYSFSYAPNDGWYGVDGMEVNHNRTTSFETGTDFYSDGGEIAVMPGVSESVVIRWSAPTGGLYTVITQIADLSIFGSTCDVHLRHNGVSYYDQEVDGQGYGTVSIAVTNVVTTIARDTIDFVVGNGDNSNNAGDVIGMYETVTPFVPLDTDLQVSMVANPPAVTAGGTITYTITVTNVGPATVPGLSLSDTLPSVLQLDSVDDTHPYDTIYESQDGIEVEMGSLAAGQAAAITMRCYATCSATSLDVVTNIVTSYFFPYDSITNNNIAMVLAPVQPSETPPRCLAHVQFHESLVDKVSCAHDDGGANGCALTTKGRFTIRATIPLMAGAPTIDGDSAIDLQVGNFSFYGTFSDDPHFTSGVHHVTLVDQHDQCNNAATSCHEITDAKVSVQWNSQQLTVTVTGQTPDYETPILADLFRGAPTSGISTSITADIGTDFVDTQFNLVNVVGTVNTKTVATSGGQLSPSSVQLTGSGVE